MLKDKKLNLFLIQFFKFGIVGILNTGLTAGTIFLFMNVFHIWYITSNVAGYVIGFGNSYIVNKLWTFKSKGSVKEQSVRFLLVFGACYALQLGLTVLLKEHFKVDANWAQAIAMAFYMVINFFGHKYITFKA